MHVVVIALRCRSILLLSRYLTPSVSDGRHRLQRLAERTHHRVYEAVMVWCAVREMVNARRFTPSGARHPRGIHHRMRPLREPRPHIPL